MKVTDLMALTVVFGCRAATVAGTVYLIGWQGWSAWWVIPALMIVGAFGYSTGRGGIHD